jgi:hypothetical protein
MVKQKRKHNAKTDVSGMCAPKSDIEKYERFIIVDDYWKPMAWGGEQLCYCTASDWQDTHFPIKIYTKSHANRLIALTHIFRKKNNFKLTPFKLMPVVGAHFR